MAGGAQKTSQFNQATTVTQADQVPLLQGGELKRVTVGVLTGAPDFGWQATGESWNFSSWNSATSIGVVTVPSDATVKYAVGQFVRISQATGGTKYAKILSITTTSLTLWMPGYTLTNEAISTPVYSPLGRPTGIPVSIADGQPYMFSAYETSGASYTSSNVVRFNSEKYDPLDVYNASNGVFTAPVAGRYHFDSNLNLQGGGGTVWGGFNKNGVAHQRFNRMDSTPGTVYSPAGGIDVLLAAGDTFTSNINFTAGGSKTLEAGWSWFTGHLLSRV